MALTAIKATEKAHPTGHIDHGATASSERVTVTLVLRRRPGDQKLSTLEDFAPGKRPQPLSRLDFAHKFGAQLEDIENVERFVRAHGLAVVASNAASRSVIVRGPASAVNEAFGVELHNYEYGGHTYRGHASLAKLPSELAVCIEDIKGLDTRRVQAKHHTPTHAHAHAHRSSSRSQEDPVNDPPKTTSLPPQRVAALYDFPPGDGSGQTIGIYEMTTAEGPAGYSAGDLATTMKAFGGGFTVPTPINVSINGTSNSGESDGETVLDITLASAIAPAATLAVYFTGGTEQDIVNAVQRMVHPNAGDPEPDVISISYGWGPDDAGEGLAESTYTTLNALFQDAAQLGITVLVSSGDSGAFDGSKTEAQASYPATDPWVIACGGTTIGNVSGTTFEEYAWNDRGAGGPGATGGGVSARFPVPSYQAGTKVPAHVKTGKAGRGVPDIAGNASENSGYAEYLRGRRAGPVGGTSAVAPLYAGLFARINANLGARVGFVNPILYSLATTAFRDITSPPGPANNSFNGVTGYPVAKGWDACTGLGSVKGTALQTGLKAVIAKSSPTNAVATRLPSRLTTSRTSPSITNTPALPVVDFAALGQEAPKVLSTPTEIPKADVVVFCWAEAEWAALHHVFVGGSQPMPYSDRTKGAWPGWVPFNQGAPAAISTWGSYCLVGVGGQKVLLFKSNAHLDEGPKQGTTYLAQLVTLILQKVSPTLVLSTGTAGGTRVSDPIGTVNVVRAGTLYEQGTAPSTWPMYDGSWTPGWTVAGDRRFPEALFAIPTTASDLASLAEQFNKIHGTNYSLAELNIGNLTLGAATPAINNLTSPEMSLLTATSFVVADTSGNYAKFACVEMDDAVIGEVCEAKQVKFGFVRNISDPVQNRALPSKVAGDWGSFVYEAYGFYTSYNGALAAWAILSAGTR
jgi:kumamolisin